MNELKLARKNTKTAINLPFPEAWDFS